MMAWEMSRNRAKMGDKKWEKNDKREGKSFRGGIGLNRNLSGRLRQKRKSRGAREKGVMVTKRGIRCSLGNLREIRT
jgi:hypothetical protein